SEQILNAVMWAEPFGAGLKRRQEEDRAVPGLPGSSGAYYRGPSGWVMLRSFLFWRPFYSVSYFHSGRPHDQNVPLRGSHANLHLTDRQPAFYLREPASRNWRSDRATISGFFGSFPAMDFPPWTGSQRARRAKFRLPELRVKYSRCGLSP